MKREGDGATPIGVWHLTHVYYRADRTARPLTRLPVRATARDDGWCDASGDRNYNRAVQLPYSASAETLWRDDGLYDLVVILDHNQRPRRRNGGSAIFVHIARPDLTPTEGCIALAAKDLRSLLAIACVGSKINVRACPRPRTKNGPARVRRAIRRY